ncbi:adenylate cyclase type 3 [Cricetulus griseus]|nr:adenylate cyclase type 3 [Cricetulus griseus]
MGGLGKPGVLMRIKQQAVSQGSRLMIISVLFAVWVVNVNMVSPLEILANVFLYLCAIVVGIMSYYMADRKHRKAFLEARQSLEVKMNLEEQSQQQV